MPQKKNNKHLISIIQEASYLLLLAYGRKDVSTKGMMNTSVAFIKKEVKKLKRI